MSLPQPSYSQTPAPQLRGISTPLGQAAALAPAGFWIRVVAVMIDGFITAMITLPVNFGMQFLLRQVKQGDGVSIGAIAGIILSYGVMMGIRFMYDGWFQKNKGATPGKMVFGMRVIDLESGGNLSYTKTFMRSFIGRFLDVLTLGIGLLMVGFRKDKRALHDLIAGTQVVRAPK